MKKIASKRERRLIIAWIWHTTLLLFLITPVFFLIAGERDWNWGWLFIGLLWAFSAAQPLLLIPINPQLLAERARGVRVEGSQSWDQPLVRGASIAWFATWILAALDRRLGWSANIGLGFHLAGALGTALGFIIFDWALVSNAFFAEGVRIQAERGHQVCDRGPYRFIRHPGYAGNIAAILSIPIFLGSIYAYIPALISAIFFLYRTKMEDDFLIKELPGYKQFAKITKFRLLPGVW